MPTAFLDFGVKPLGDAQPQDRFYGLLTLRNDLGESTKGNYSLPFRRFDFSCVWYLHKKRNRPMPSKHSSRSTKPAIWHQCWWMC
ncbi:MAG: hypothetical protein WBG32_01015 [Nodosilinea sp.]